MADNKPVEGEVVKHELQVILDEQGVSDKGAQELVEAFGGPFNEVGEILANYETIKVTDVAQVEEMKKARDYRLQLKNARTTVERKRKELKEDSLKKGRAIDAVARFVKETIEPAEKYLEEQEKFRQIQEEKQRAERLAARTSAIAKFADPALYNLDTMEEEAFQQLLIKLEADAAAAAEAERAEIERQEAERKAELERQKKIAEENERLQREAKEREAAEQRKLDRVNEVTRLGMVWNAEAMAYELYDMAVTAANIVELNDVKWRQLFSGVEQAILGKRAEEQKAAQEAEAAAEAQREKERAEADEARKKAEELERAEAERRAAEEKAAADRAAAEHAALLAPDKEKITVVRSKLEAIKLDLPATKDKAAQELVANVYDQIEKIEAYIEKGISNL